MNLIKVEMKLNKERILDDGEYTPERIMKGVDNAFAKHGFRKEILEDGTICFWGNRQSDDFAKFGGLVVALHKTEWFMPYVDKWLWYNSDGQLDEKCYRIEDILFFFTKKRSVA